MLPGDHLLAVTHAEFDLVVVLDAFNGSILLFSGV